MALWIADEERGLMHISREMQNICPQPLCLTICGDSVICAAREGARVYARDARELACYPLPPGVCRMCALPGALYCLSGDADSVNLLCPATGRLRLCARAGCYPQDMKISSCGRMLAVAGGAAGQVLLLSAQDLTLLRQFSLPGMVYAVCFAGNSLYALCAAEENDIATHLMRISPRGVVSDVFSRQGLPGAMCTLRDQTLLCGVLGETLRLRTDGRVVQRYPGGLAQSIRAYGDFALIADPLSGCVQRVELAIGKSAGTVYPGASPSDMLLM